VRFLTEIAALPQKIVDRKTIVLKSRLDSNMVRLLGEKLKRRFFTRAGFLKPKSRDIRLIYLDKYYEPYFVLGGKYFLDYCKRHAYAVKVEDDMREVFINGKKLKSEPLNSEKSSKVIRFEGEEHSHHEVETYFILDRLGREVLPENVPFAPFEERLDNSDEIGIKLRKGKISQEKEIEFLQSRIAKRPSDVAEVIREIFDINERTIIYSPIYHLTFQNIKTGKEAIALINGITGEVIFGKFNKTTSGRIIGDFIEACPEDRAPTKIDLIEEKQESSSITESAEFSKETTKDLNRDFNDQQPVSNVLEVKEKLDFPAKVVGEVFHVGDNVTAVFGDLEIPSGTTVSETLAVRGTLEIGDYCRILGKVKALRDVMIGANTTIDGDVISGGGVVIGPDSIINGSVESAEHVEIGENAVIAGGLHEQRGTVNNNEVAYRQA
jgi:acetyltransferase-like isoleucine patch superfamily enzyme